MDTWIWIVIAVVVVLAALFVVGLVLSKRRQVSLTERPDTPAVETDTKPKGGGYKAGGSISFSSGGGTALEDRPSTPEPAEPGSAAPTRSGQTPSAPAPAESGTVEPVPAEPIERPSGPTTAPTAPESGTPEPGTLEPGTVESDVMASDESESTEPQVAEQHAVDQAEPTGLTPTAGEPVVTDVPSTPDVQTPRGERAPSAPETAEPDRATPLSEAPVPVETGTAAEVEEIAPADGRLNRLRGRLSRSQNAFGRSMLGLLGAGNLDEDSWIDVEDTLLLADLGAQASAEIAEKLRDEVAAHGLADPAAARALLRRVMIEAVDPTMDRSVRALPHDGRPSVLLVVGVNGTGKTTTTGKLARVLVAQGRNVLLGAADTFRAAAADQLATWAERTGATVVRAKEGTDPASVAFDSVKAGIEGGVDAVVIDTAGRLHTKTGLMDELGKVKRVIQKQTEVDEVLLVLDATTGQNGLVQARVFAEVVDITGIVLTKLDGTAKGGIVVAVQRALGVPVKLVGLGEGPDDLAPFEAEAFVDALLGD